MTAPSSNKRFDLISNLIALGAFALIALAFIWAIWSQQRAPAEEAPTAENTVTVAPLTTFTPAPISPTPELPTPDLPTATIECCASETPTALDTVTVAPSGTPRPTQRFVTAIPTETPLATFTPCQVGCETPVPEVATQPPPPADTETPTPAPVFPTPTALPTGYVFSTLTPAPVLPTPTPLVTGYIDQGFAGWQTRQAAQATAWAPTHWLHETQTSVARTASAPTDTPLPTETLSITETPILTDTPILTPIETPTQIPLSVSAAMNFVR